MLEYSIMFFFMPIAVIGDSRIFPRVNPNNEKTSTVNRNDTFAGLLKNKGFEIDLYGYGGVAGRRIANICGYLEYCDYNHFIFLFGINDLAPRALRLYEVIVMQIFGFRFGKRINVILRKYRKITRTSPKEFRNIALTIKELIPENKIRVILNPEPNNNTYLQKMPNIKKNISTYNNILREIFGEKNCIELSDKSLSDDSIHLSRMGHSEVCKKILESL